MSWCYVRTLLSFLEFSQAIKASLALWSVFKFFIIVVFFGVDVIAGALDRCKDDSLGWCQLLTGKVKICGCYWEGF